MQVANAKVVAEYVPSVAEYVPSVAEYPNRFVANANNFCKYVKSVQHNAKVVFTKALMAVLNGTRLAALASIQSADAGAHFQFMVLDELFQNDEA